MNKTKRKYPKRGFGSMKRKDVLRIARMGGYAVSKNRKHMAFIGAIGGAA